MLNRFIAYLEELISDADRGRPRFGEMCAVVIFMIGPWLWGVISIVMRITL